MINPHDDTILLLALSAASLIAALMLALIL